MLSRLYQSASRTCRHLSVSSRVGIIFKSAKPELEFPAGSFTDHMMKSIYKHYVQNPSKIAIIDVSDPTKNLSYGDVYLRSLSVSAYLRHNDFHHGQVAAVVLPNNVNYPSIAFGITLNGGAITQVSVAYTPREMVAQFLDSNAKIVFTAEKYLDTVMTAVEQSPNIEKVIVIKDEDRDELIESDKIIDFKVVREFVPVSHHELVEVNPTRDIFSLPYSSGTTGPPKGVMLSHEGVKSAILNFCESIYYDCFASMEPPFDPINNNHLIFLPFYHTYGFCLMLGTLNAGGTITTMPKLELDLFCQTIQDYKIRTLLCVPPIMVFFAKHPIVDKYDLSSLETVICGAAPLYLETINLVKTRLPHVKNVLQGYGATEMSMTAMLPSIKNPCALDSVGRLQPGVEMKIVDPETQKELGYNEKGEMWFKSKQIMMGYLNKPQSTAETLDDEGWLHTGDIGYIEDCGQCFVVDRVKELIKVSGYQVAPAELEALLLEHPQVKDVAVIGVADEVKGEVPRAFVVRGADSTVTEKELQEFVAARAAPYKKLRGGVVFVDLIPKSASGKILRRVLRAQV